MIQHVLSVAPSSQKKREEKSFENGGPPFAQPIMSFVMTHLLLLISWESYFFLSQLQRVNIHKRTLPCLKPGTAGHRVWQACLQQSHILATTFVLQRAALDP